MKFSNDLFIALLQAQHVVIFSGAGMSAESGIATFRDAQTGLWERYDPYTLASPDGFLADKALVWGWYEWRRMQVLKAQPNEGHLAIADLKNFVNKLTLITQNVDDFHERAGNRRVIHVHGSLHQPRCFDCGLPYKLPEGIPNEPEGGRRLDPPICKNCSGPIRPGVVWFGESVLDWDRAEQVAMESDVFFSIGTSSLVWPAAQLPERASLHGATVIQINPDSTSLDNTAHINFRGKVGDIMPALVSSLSDFFEKY